MKTIVPDFDDLYLDPANGLNWLFWLKGKYPKFKATLFTIPFRSTHEFLVEVKKHDWIELAVHGFIHDEDETFELFKEDMEKHLDDIERSGLYVKGFKGANWIVSDPLIKILAERNYWIATKGIIDEEEAVKRVGLPVRQWPLTDERVLHGHIWMMETHKNEGKFEFDKDTDFKFISEVMEGGEK